MTLSKELQERGFVHQFTAETLGEILDDKKRFVYHGFDPSADSIHAGNFVQWMLLKHLAKHGHTIVLLVGGATGRIGDPKPDSERPLIDEEEINRRVLKMKAQAEHLLGDTVELVNNYDWFKEIKFLDFLRDIGKHFTVNELMKKDAIATRLGSETGLSYTEFAYPLVQGYDYLVLYRTKGCTLQTGGSDQWGNMITGVDMIRKIEKAEAHVLTTPLIIDKTTGKKFGKSEGNAVWLDPEKTSPYHFYQFWLNVADENVIDYLKLFTLLSLDEIAEVEQAHLQAAHERQAQKVLAQAVTTMVHGETMTVSVKAVSEILFGEGDTATLDETGKRMLLDNAPTYTTVEGVSIVDVLVAGGLASSKREARTFIESGAVSLGGEKITDSEAILGLNHFVHGIALLKRGKKQYIVLTLS